MPRKSWTKVNLSNVRTKSEALNDRVRIILCIVCDWGSLFSFIFLLSFFQHFFFSILFFASHFVFLVASYCCCCRRHHFILDLLVRMENEFSFKCYKCLMMLHHSPLDLSQMEWDSKRTMTRFHCKMNRKTWTHQLNQCHYRRICLVFFPASFIHHFLLMIKRKRLVRLIWMHGHLVPFHLIHWNVSKMSEYYKKRENLFSFKHNQAPNANQSAYVSTHFNCLARTIHSFYIY